MPYIVVVSGPKGQLNGARRALSGAGLTVPDQGLNHGLADRTDGSEDPSVGWLTVEAGHPDTVVRLLPAGWTLRAHFPQPEPTEPDPVASLAAQVAELRAEIESMKQAA